MAPVSQARTNSELGYRVNNQATTQASSQPGEGLLAAASFAGGTFSVSLDRHLSDPPGYHISLKAADGILSGWTWTEVAWQAPG